MEDEEAFDEQPEEADADEPQYDEDYMEDEEAFDEQPEEAEADEAESKHQLQTHLKKHVAQRVGQKPSNQGKAAGWRATQLKPKLLAKQRLVIGASGARVMRPQLKSAAKGRRRQRLRLLREFFGRDVHVRQRLRLPREFFRWRRVRVLANAIAARRMNGRSPCLSAHCA